MVKNSLFVSLLLMMVACQPNSQEPAGGLTGTASQMMPIIVNDETPAGALPDLLIRYYRVDYDDCPWGGPGTITAHLKNNGLADAGPFEVEINGAIANVAGLPAGQEGDAITQFPAGPIGGVNITADPTNQIAESDETNNSYNIVFTPPPPCITPTP